MMHIPTAAKQKQKASEVGNNECKGSLQVDGIIITSKKKRKEEMVGLLTATDNMAHHMEIGSSQKYVVRTGCWHCQNVSP